MRSFTDVQKEVDAELEQYVKGLFDLSGNPRRYYYWSLNFFETVGGLSFQYFELSYDQKEDINFYGSKYFDSYEVDFSVNKNSHRHDITIRNIHKLYENSKIARQSDTYEYIKEYIFWQLLKNYENDLFVELESEKSKVSNQNEDLILQKTKDHDHIKSLVKIQRLNFLHTYLKYLSGEHQKPIHKYFIDDYINYPLTSLGNELIEKLDELDRDFVYDPKTGKEIKQTTQNLNADLREKIARLYVLKSDEQNLHFVFSRNSGGGKEELRELLDIMGDRDSGNMYRGQADSSWILDSSITRERKFLESESDMYYDILSLKPDAFQNDSTVYERLITMQHFGMPTRLLDVSRNPLVAIFFACNNWETKHLDGTIFTFKPPNDKTDFLTFEDKKLEYLSYLYSSHLPVNTSKKDVEDFLSKIWFIKGVAKNQRISNQSGDFIFVGKGENVKDDLHILPAKTVIIDSASKEVLLQQLDSLNVHGGAVYPDLTNLSRYIKRKFENGVSVEQKKKTEELEKSDNLKKPQVKKTKASKPKQRETAKFDFKKLKGKSRKSQISSFCQFHNLSESKLDKIIDDYLFTEKRPFRDEVAKASNTRMSVIKNQKKIDSVIDDIITLAKMIGSK